MRRIEKVELIRVVPEERSALYELVDEYLAELSERRERPVGPTTAQGYRYLPLYWTEAGRHPFFISSQGQRVGFALVREVPRAGTIQMSDFFIRQHARRSGVGRLAVAAIWRRFPGSWELQVHVANRAASEFWSDCIAQLSTGGVRKELVQEEDGGRVQYNFEIATT